jgi:hypothetical protein
MIHQIRSSVALQLDAPEDRVARFLKDEGMVVRTDREPGGGQTSSANTDSVVDQYWALM